MRTFRVGWVYVPILIAAVALQSKVAIALFKSGLVGGDPAAQYTTGVMVFDYLRTALGSSPLDFAISYYVRFPKVAFGHWPPVYFGIQALWYQIFGPHVFAARLLSGCFAFTMAALIGFTVRRFAGIGLAIGAGSLFLTLPLVQQFSWDVMSDLLVGLFILPAILAFSDFLERRDRRSAFMFSLWAVLAILTKGSAWALMIFIPLAPFLARRQSAFRTSWYWISVALVIALGAPFYVVTSKANLGYPANIRDIVAGKVPLAEHLAGGELIIQAASLLILGVSLLGLVAALRERWGNHEQTDRRSVTVLLASGTWVIAHVLFNFLLPLTMEARFFLPCLAPLTLLLCYALFSIERVFNKWRFSWAIPPVAMLLIIAIASAPELDAIQGYDKVANAIPYKRSGSVILVSSSASGEGAIITERLDHDQHRAGVLLRASKMLSESTWMGDNYRLLHSNVDSIRRYLQDLPVRYVILDNSVQPMPHHKLLERALVEMPESFSVVGRYQISGRRHPGEVIIYENKLGGARQPEIIRVPLGPERNSRVLEYRMPKDCN